MHKSGVSTGVLDAMWPHLQRRLYYFPMTWPSCGILGETRFSLTSRDTWALYDVVPLFYLFIMLLTLFFQAVQATFKVEEITNCCYQKLDDERKRRVLAVQSFNIADQSIKDLRKKLAKEEKARKSADLALEGAQRQTEEQRQLLREAKDQLASSKEEIAALKKKLEEAQKLKDHAEKLRAEAEKAKVEAEKARDEAEQHGYDVDVAKIEDTLRAQVSAIYQTYCAHTWEEALN